MSDKKYRPVEDVVDLAAREEDFKSAITSLATESVKKVTDVDGDDIANNEKNYKINVSAKYAEAVADYEDQKKCEQDLKDLVNIVLLNQLDKIVQVTKSVNKLIEHIDKMGVNDINALIKNITTFISKYQNGSYKLKNNLIDFDQDGYFSEREYINSEEVLLEIMIYDIYSYIVNPVAKAFTSYDFAIDVFDPVIKYLHLRFGQDAVNYRNKDDIYDLYGLKSVEYEAERQKFISNSSYEYASKNREALLSTSLMTQIQPALDILKNNIKGVGEMNIESKRIYDEVFSLAEETGVFLENIDYINKIASENTSEDVWDIANYVIYSIKNKANKIDSDGYKTYKEELRVLKEKYLVDDDEEMYIRALFYKYYNITKVDDKLSSQSLLEEVISYNNVLKKEKSLDFRVQKLVTLFNNYSQVELKKRLSVEVETENDLSEVDMLNKLYTMSPEEFVEESGDISTYIFELYSKKANGIVKPSDYVQHDKFLNQMSDITSGFLKKEAVSVDEFIYIVKSIAEDYESGVDVNQLLNRLEALESILMNYSDNGPLEKYTEKNRIEMYDFTVNHEDVVTQNSEGSYNENMFNRFQDMANWNKHEFLPVDTAIPYRPPDTKIISPIEECISENNISSQIKVELSDNNTSDTLEINFIDQEIAKKLVLGLSQQRISE